MKAILEFNLPEENEELYLAKNGHRYAILVNDILEYLRGKYKYQENYEAAMLRDYLTKLIEDSGLEI